MLSHWTLPNVEVTMVAETRQPHVLGPVMRITRGELKPERDKHKKDGVSAREEDLYVDGSQHLTRLLP